MNRVGGLVGAVVGLVVGDANGGAISEPFIDR